MAHGGRLAGTEERPGDNPLALKPQLTGMGDRVGPEIVLALVHQPFDLVEERREPGRGGEDEEHRALYQDPGAAQAPSAGA